MLPLNGIPVIEVEENELGLPVTAAFHVKVPPRHNGVFQVNVHGDMKGTHNISANSQFLGGLSLHLNHLYSIAHDNLRLAIWDTSFWTFWLKFGYKGP